MKDKLKEKSLLYLTGFVQIFLVSVNTLFISQKKYPQAFIVSFLISTVWSYNIKKIAFGGMMDRFYYSLGAATGCVLGIAVSNYLM